MIDVWSPSPGFRQIRGKFLRKNAQLMDIPAAIMFGGLSLSLIKSEVYD